MKRLPLLLLFVAATVSAQDFMPVEFDATTGKLMMHINHIGDEFLYVVSLPAGVGSNPIGLDRGEMGETHVVRFDRVGPNVLRTHKMCIVQGRVRSCSNSLVGFGQRGGSSCERRM